MVPRRALICLLVGAFASLGATYRTQNFVVTAATPQIAEQVGQYAEHYRKEKALLWLGQEMQPWGQPCPVRVTVTMNGSGGATSFAFDNGQILSQNMHIEGTLDRLLASVLPHEVTHTVFAYRFRTPVPRWADEGGAVLSEDDQERNRHDQLVREILRTPGKRIPLRNLFALKDYPHEVMSLYAEGYSVANFLVSTSSRAAFLAFVDHGMRYGWDNAVQTHYASYGNVNGLEAAWLNHLRETARPQGQLLARNTAGPAAGDATGRISIRQTVPPAQPLRDSPQAVYRGQAPDEGWDRNQRRPAGGQPRYLPDYNPATPTIAASPLVAPPHDQWGPPQGQQPYDGPPRVRLGPPEFAPQAPSEFAQPVPENVSPAGYPR